MCKENQCLYCENITKDPHFVSGCCDRGMCDECYDGLVGTDEQIQILYSDLEDNEYEILVKKGRENYDYVCYSCFNNAK